MRCASCRSPLDAGDEEQLRDIVRAHRNSTPSARSISQQECSQRPSTRSAVEESFILLDGSRRDRRAASRPLEESYVMLVPAAERGGPSAATASSRPPDATNQEILDARLHALDLATTASQVEQPLCKGCCQQVETDIRSEMKKLQQEADAYEAALERLQTESPPNPPAQIAAVLNQQQEAESRDRARAEKAEAELAAEIRRLDGLKAAADEVTALEQRYWRAFNELDLQLAAHLQERDTILAKIEVADAQLEALNRTNVWNDVFHIWQSGPFATINGARLGRAAGANVTWDEVNAAWGHAVLTLHTLAQVCHLKFRHHRLLPMGSYARVATSRASFDLYGPVNRLTCAKFDVAQVAFLACLKEFEDHARGRDRSQGCRTLFELPYAIDGDKVGGQSIKLFCHKEEAWTKALKFMAADLKFALKWVITEHDKALSVALSARSATRST